jgi:hypothetical protein
MTNPDDIEPDASPQQEQGKGSASPNCSRFADLIGKLRRYNRWRRREEDWEDLHPFQVGVIIDDAANTIESLDRELLEARREFDRLTRHAARYRRQASRLFRAEAELARWLEWARMHGHLEYADGVASSTREFLSENV